MKNLSIHHCKIKDCNYMSKYMSTFKRHQSRCIKRFKCLIEKNKRLSSTKEKSNGKKKIHKNPFKEIDLHKLKVKECIGRGKYGAIFYGNVCIKKKKYSFISKISHESHLDEHKMEKKVYTLLEKKYLNNQNFLRYYGSLSIRGGHVLILESLSSITLEDFFKKTKTSKIEIKMCYALKLWRKLLSGLKDLHEIGIVHNDLKPNNIGFRLNENGENSEDPILFDFGMSESFIGKKETDEGEFGTFPIYRSMRTLKNYHQTFPKDEAETLAYIFMKYLLGMDWETPQNITNKQKRLLIHKKKHEFIYQDLSPALKNYVNLFEYVKYTNSLQENEKLDYVYLDKLLAETYDIFSKKNKRLVPWKRRIKKRALVHKEGLHFFTNQYFPYQMELNRIMFCRRRERDAIVSQESYGTALKPLEWIAYDHVEGEKMENDKNYIEHMIELQEPFEQKRPLELRDIKEYLSKAGFDYIHHFHFIRCEEKDKEEISKQMISSYYKLFIVYFPERDFFATYLSYHDDEGPHIISFDSTSKNFMPRWPKNLCYSNRRLIEEETWKTGYIACYYAELLLRTGFEFWNKIEEIDPQTNLNFIPETPEVSAKSLSEISERNQISEESEAYEEESEASEASEASEGESESLESMIDYLSHLDPRK